MRLTEDQVLAITQIVSRLAGETAETYLFGSRLDDGAQGGDVDLLIETDNPLTLIDRARIKIELETRLQLPVDILAKARSAPPTPFQAIAYQTAGKLGKGRLP
jgi:predicted nucleotidyltransferase